MILWWVLVVGCWCLVFGPRVLSFGPWSLVVVLGLWLLTSDLLSLVLMHWLFVLDAWRKGTFFFARAPLARHGPPPWSTL